MGKIAKCFFVLAMLASSGFSSADFYDGNELYNRLKDYKSENTQSAIKAGAGQGYILGVADAMDGRLDPVTKFKFCLPKNVKVGQLIDVVFAFLDKNPQSRHFSAWSLVLAAYEAAFPC